MVAVLLLSFDGTNYCGWQIQKNAVSIQFIVQNAVESALKIQTKVIGCSRTDAGVHAYGYVCSFAIPENLNIPERQIAFAINRYLPLDIRVLKSAVLAQNDFYACSSAIKKRYRYTFYCDKIEQPLLERYAVRVYPPIDLEKIQKCAILLEGKHNFKAFSNTGSSVKTTVRTVYAITVQEENGVYSIEVCGDGFLYNMVRILAGSLIAVGQGKLSIEQLLKALKSGDRALTGKTMPARGLALINVDYNLAIFS